MSRPVINKKDYIQEVGVDVKSSSLNFLFTPNKKPDFEIGKQNQTKAQK